uniref:Uncharacterized protein n=5 Tax=Enterobacteriaceae TaxID=543 RepID=A0A1Z1VVR1_SHIFL|nr:CopG family transcriptional regulator [Shigella flexneri]ARX75788.1 hypothetical protein [Shigella flexneri Y]
MALDLKTPVIPGQKTEQTNADTARFINEATRKKSGATKVTNVRLGDVYEDILEREALRTGQTKTAIMKAALAAYEHGLDENGIYGHSRFCNTDFDDKLACLNLSGV